jgi:DNA-binding CsgD family transcriptional regulator
MNLPQSVTIIVSEDRPSWTMRGFPYFHEPFVSKTPILSSNSIASKTKHLRKKQRRFDSGESSLSLAAWNAISQTPGVGISITDANGRLLFVNDTSLVLFSGTTDVDYAGKTIADFHPKEFVAERLSLIARVLREGKPIRLRHIYLGKPIESTIWPLKDNLPPHNRVLVVSRTSSNAVMPNSIPPDVESVESKYIDLGPLNVLTKRELEVLVLLGHGMSIPKVASILFRSPKTIERHKTAIGKKLSLRGQSELVNMVTMMGLELRDSQRKRLDKS